MKPTRTIATKIKEELFQAELAYTEALADFRAKHPHGVDFCFETVNAKAATDAIHLYEKEAAFNAIVTFVRPRFERSSMDAQVAAIIERYNNAETCEAVEAIQQEYYALYSIDTK